MFVDKEDYCKVESYFWTLSGGYVLCQGVLLHRLIMDAPKDLDVDHINGNKLDNRKCNLRICSCTENIRHKVNIGKNNKSGKCGVNFEKRCNKWHARIGVNKSSIHLGRFDKLEDAIEARKEAEIEYFGEFKPIV